MSKLASLVQRGAHLAPARVLLYGPEGIGKTTWAAGAPGSLFLGTEDGYGALDVARLPAAHTWRDVLDAVRLLRTEDHEFTALIIDTIDHMERLAWEAVVSGSKCSSIEDIPYGKGYVQALELHQRLAAELDKLRTERGMHIIMLAHSQQARVQNPEGADYEKYTLKMHKSAASFWKEWADALLFAHLDVTVRTAERGDRALLARGKATGSDRVIETVASPAYDAKCRMRVPDTLPLTWRAFADAYGWARIPVGRDGNTSEPDRQTEQKAPPPFNFGNVAAAMRKLDDGWTDAAILAQLGAASPEAVTRDPAVALYEAAKAGNVRPPQPPRPPRPPQQNSNTQQAGASGEDGQV